MEIFHAVCHEDLQGCRVFLSYETSDERNKRPYPYSDEFIQQACVRADVSHSLSVSSLFTAKVKTDDQPIQLRLRKDMATAVHVFIFARSLAIATHSSALTASTSYPHTDTHIHAMKSIAVIVALVALGLASPVQLNENQSDALDGCCEKKVLPHCPDRPIRYGLGPVCCPNCPKEPDEDGDGDNEAENKEVGV